MSHTSHDLVSSGLGLHRIGPHCLSLPLTATSLQSQVATAHSAHLCHPHVGL